MRDNTLFDQEPGENGPTGYSVVPMGAIADAGLSFTAMGLLAAMYAYLPEPIPDDGLYGRSTPREEVDAALAELRAAGLIPLR